MGLVSEFAGKRGPGEPSPSAPPASCVSMILIHAFPAAQGPVSPRGRVQHVVDILCIPFLEEEPLGCVRWLEAWVSL